MGCGSSSTQVQTFREPDENTRRHSSPKIVLAQTRPKSKDSSHSLSSRASTTSSKSKKTKHEETVDNNIEQFSRNSSANTKRTYILDHNIDGNVIAIGEEADHEHEDGNILQLEHVHQNDNIEHDNTPQTNIFITNKDSEEHIDTFEEIHNEMDHNFTPQTNIFITNKESEEHFGDFQKIHNDNNDKNQDQETKTVSNILDEDEQIILENGLSPLDIPEVDETRAMKDYTIDDLVNDKTLFKYGQNVYSNDIMQPIIQERIRQYKEVATVPYMYGVVYPVFVARNSGVTRKEMKQLLPVCQVGRYVNLPPDQYLSRMKQDVQQILEEGPEEDSGEGLGDYKQQLSRWLQKYPNVGSENKMSNYQTDPNEVSFPVVIDDPTEFRKWIVDWESFDTEVPEDGAWSSYEFKPIQDPDLAKQVHEQFVSIVELREDKSIEALDMTIDGEAAWFVIELDIVKNDTATDSQIKIWSLREKRTNLGDTEWMAKRRREIADIFLQRHDSWDADVVTPYMAFAENLEEAWKGFQELCDKPFDPPEKYKILYLAKGDKNTLNLSEDGPSVQSDQINNNSQNILKLESSGEHSEDSNNLNNEPDGPKTAEGLIESNDDKSNEVGVDGRDNVQSTPVENAVQDEGRPQMETMDSGLELDTSDAFYK